jgi:hypothetical protein
MEEAIIARNNAYAYSKFKVGAALLLEYNEVMVVLIKRMQLILRIMRRDSSNISGRSKFPEN